MTAVRVGGGKSVNSSGTLRPSGKYVGEFDPALGLPVAGSGKDGAILKGDFWKASGSGTIADLVPFTVFVAGDLIYANSNNASIVGEFFGNKGTGGSGGSGDVVGPAAATDGAPALFDGTTGKLIKNSTPTGTGNPVLATVFTSLASSSLHSFLGFDYELDFQMQ